MTDNKEPNYGDIINEQVNIISSIIGIIQIIDSVGLKENLTVVVERLTKNIKELQKYIDRENKKYRDTLDSMIDCLKNSRPFLKL